MPISPTMTSTGEFAHCRPRRRATPSIRAPSRLLLLLTVSTLIVAVVSQGDLTSNTTKCNVHALLDCFMKRLGSWAKTLYKIRENVVTISKDDCQHLRAMGVCIDDADPAARHHCGKEKVLNLSHSITDILTQRKESGSFLKSYYLLEYACSEPGQQILDKHRDCLRDERIGLSTQSASHYLSSKYLSDGGRTTPDGEACGHLKERLGQYQQAMKKICDGDAAKLMCESLKRMFTGVYHKKLEGCQLDCGLSADQTTAAGGVTVGVAAVGGSNGQTAHQSAGNDTSAAGDALLTPHRRWYYSFIPVVVVAVASRNFVSN